MATLLIAAGASAGVSAGVTSVIASTAISVGLGLVKAALTPDQIVKRNGARISEAQITSSAEGSPIDELAGRARIGGEMIWATSFKETVVTTTDSQGGKGGPKLVTETTEYLYSTSFAIALCKSDGDTIIGRVWADGKLLDLSNFTYRFYDGSQSQLPDPKIEAVEGVGTVSAYRGVAYIVFEDMPLADFGNRIPQINVEVNRSTSTESPAAMENSLQAVNIIPGAGEFVYGVESYHSDDDEGNSLPENTTGSSGNTDFVASLDRLADIVPGVTSASLVVSWFGDDTDATVCTVRPKVDNTTKNVKPSAWRVSDRVRSNAELVSDYDGSPAFGGTPSDQTVREAVAEMKERGLRVMFYPFMLMDTTGYPWRGEVAGDPTNFLGTAAPGDFASWNGTQIAYTGPNEWSHRRFILHYARLLEDLLDSGDAFLVGSEMVGLSAAQASWGTGLATLMTDVRTILDAGVNVSYASDWSEYDEANLAPVWSSADFIGIDWYLPLTDWRTSSDETYTRQHFIDGVTGGEYWDYYYASEADRENNVRTPITSPEYRQKDIGYWRDNNVSGKPIWLTEFGCGAVDKGGNQPNVFPDEKTGAGLPYFSDGSRNDTVQRLYIEALLEYFGDNTSIVDPANMFVWTWDARPFPAFPSNLTKWSDGVNWETGHWITGRVGGASVAETVLELCLQMGVDESSVDVTGLATITTRIRGMHVTDVTSARATLENLMATYLFDAYEDGPTLVFIDRQNSTEVTIGEDHLIDEDDSSPYALTRKKDTDLPDRVKVDFVDELRSFNAASVDGHTVTGFSQRIQQFTSICVLGTDYARSLADTLVHEQWTARNGIEFSVPFSVEDTGDVYLGVLKPGTNFTMFGRRYRIIELIYSDAMEVRAVGYNANVYLPVDHASIDADIDSVAAYGSPLVTFMDIPLRDADEPNQWSPRIAARQNPWPGRVLFYREDGSGGHTLNTSADVEAVIGETTDDFAKGTPWVWDESDTVNVRLYDPDATLSSVADLAVLNGANAMLIETPSGEWEVFQFANATLEGDGTYTLSRMLRGQLGTEPYMGDPTPAGARVIIYDSQRFTSIEGTAANLGLDVALRYGPSGVLLSDGRYVDETVVPRGVAFRPYAPTDLNQYFSGVDIVLEWKRRTRYDGDTWDVVEVPLNEEYERYEIDILDGATVVRTIQVDDATTYTYTEADQITDFGSAQTSVDWVVYQMSATFGRGSPANG